MLELPIRLWLLVAAPLILLPGILAIREGRLLAGAISSGLRLLCFATIVLALSGLRIAERRAAHGMTVVAALDESRSIAPDQHAWMLGRVASLRRAMDPRDQLAVIGFGRDAHVLTAPGDPRLGSLKELQVDGGGTDIAGALVASSGLFPQDREKRILLLTDGNETEGDVLSEVPEMAERGVRIYTGTPPTSKQPRVAIAGFEAPNVVRAGASFALHVDIDSEAPTPTPAVIRLFADDSAVGARRITLAPGLNRFQLPYRVARAGAYRMKATVEVAPPLVVANPKAEAALSVAPPPRVLMISDNPSEALVQVLRLRGYEVAMAAPHGLPQRAADYLPYQAVLVVNTLATAIDQPAQQALNRYVADFGGGLIVVGDSLRDSNFHNGPLEKALPVEIVAQPPPPSREPIAVYLLIDRSNSMSYNSRFPAVRDSERIRYAKQAAAALLNQLDDTDYAGVIAFDSEPYVLGHLRPLAQDRAPLLDRIRRLEPGGGTDFKEALEIAEQEILASGIAVREVILLTDGDTNRQYHDHDQLMMGYAQHEVPLSTIRIGPDLENLRLLQDFAQVTGGIFYRVEDITKLPQLLVHLTNEARNFKLHEHPQIDAIATSSILNGINPRTIPPIDYFAVTQPKDGAAVPLTVRKGGSRAPLLATWQYELGRTAIFSGDPDSMGSFGWLRWNHYAEFWSQLIGWVAREGDPGALNLSVRNSPGGVLEVSAEQAYPAPISNLFCRVSGGRHVSDIALSQAGPTVYRGESAPLAAGKYSLVLMIKAGDTERVLLRREMVALGQETPDAAELRLKPANVALMKHVAQATRGAYDADLAQIALPSGKPVLTWRSIGPVLYLAAILSLLADIWLRHRYLTD